MPFDVSVAREQFQEGFKPFIKLNSKKKLGDARLSISGRYLQVDCENVTVKLPATGVWAGDVYVSGKVMVALAQVPPIGDPVRLRVRDDRLVIGTMTAPCGVTLSDRPGSELVLSAADLRGPVERAQADLIRKAARLLQPLGVSVSDIERVVAASRGSRDIQVPPAPNGDRVGDAISGGD